MRKKQSTDRHRGQALIMTTLALIPMFGLMGLAVDLGWMEFTKKSAQTAADAAAMAALNPGRDCIYVMDPAGSDAIHMSGSPRLVSSCGVYINSNNATALLGVGTPTLSASELDIVGNYSFAGTLNPDPPSTNVAVM